MIATAQMMRTARGALLRVRRAHRLPRQRLTRRSSVFLLVLTRVLREEDLSVRGEDTRMFGLWCGRAAIGGAGWSSRTISPHDRGIPQARRMTVSFSARTLPGATAARGLRNAAGMLDQLSRLRCAATTALLKRGMRRGLRLRVNSPIRDECTVTVMIRNDACCHHGRRAIAGTRPKSSGLLQSAVVERLNPILIWPQICPPNQSIVELMRGRARR